MNHLSKVACAVVSALLTLPASAADKPIVGFITKSNDNPFFVKMLEGANAAAAQEGVELRNLQAYSAEAQDAAIETLVSAGAKGILIVPGDTKAIVPAVKKAREDGVLVIAIDHPVSPADAADGTIGTNNFQAGEIIGAWARKTLGAAAAKAKIAMLDDDATQATVDVQRDHGFLKGFGIAYGNPNINGSENDPRIVGHALTKGNEEGGRTAMETLLQKDPDINVVYTINEPAAAGAYQALKAAGKGDGSVLVVSVDGGCPGVKNVGAGVIGATAMQFPLLMASKGVHAVAEYLKTGKKPEPSPGLNFTNTGVELVTNKPAEGLASIDAQEAQKKCWG
ncbi:MAG: substrate-binding domain-containing protein [Hyphomicrobiales bacterium]|nr:substrate-binding domain-containing protein [Hyphomicrobiales bacterium]